MPREESPGPTLDPARPRLRRGLVGAVALLVLAAAVTVGWWVVVRGGDGWAGITFHGPVQGEEVREAYPLMDAFTGREGEVRTVYAGSPAQRAGLEAGDRLLTLSGVEVDDLEGLEDLSTRLGRGDAVEYTWVRDGEETSATVRLRHPLSIPLFAIGLASSLLVGLGFLVVSLLVLRAKPSSRPAWVFYLLCLVGALLFFAMGVVELEMTGSRGILPVEAQGLRVMALMAVYIPLGVVVANLLLHLILLFPRPRPLVERRPEVITWLHTASFLPLLAVVTAFGLPSVLEGNLARVAVQLAAGAALVALLARLRRRHRRRGGGLADTLTGSPWATQGAALSAIAVAAPLLPHLPDRLVVLIAVLLMIGVVVLYSLLAPVLYLVLTLVPMIRNYRQSGVEGKRQLRWPLWGVSVALGLSTLLSLVLFALNSANPDLASNAWCNASVMALVKAVYLLIPVSFAFAIVKYRLMEIDLLLRKTVVYGAVSGVVVLGSLVLAGGAGVALVSWSRIDSPVLAVGATLLLVALLVPVRNRVQTFVDRRFGRTDADREAALERVRREVVTAADLEELLSPMAETVQQALGSRSLVLFVQRPDGRRLVAHAKVGLPDEVLGQLQLSPAPLATAPRVAELDTLALDDEEGDQLRRLRTAVVAPARRGGAVVGAVACGRKLDGTEPDADELDFLSAVADQLALAVSTLGPRRETIELDQARTMQRSLLPDTLPQPPGAELAATWRPAREVAGDYYDAIDLGDGRVALCIGDVVGKGMPAALLMSSLQAAVRAVAAPDLEPRRVCEQVRRVVIQSLTGGRFVTFFYAVLDAPRRRLAYSNAGHAPPLRVRPDGSVERLESGGGAFVRLLADTPLEGAELELAAGDRLVLYTDGVTEAQPPPVGGDPSGDALFGEERLVELVRKADDEPAATTVERLVRAVEAHSAGAHADDLTLLVARIR